MSAFFVILFFNVGAANPPRAQLPVYVESELAAVPIVTSIVQSTFHIVFAAMLLVGGFLADRFRPKRTFIIGLLTPAIAGFLLIAQEVWLLAIVAALTGTFFAFHAAGSRAYLVLAVPLKRMGLLGNLYELGFTLGAAIGNAAVGFVAAQSGFQLAGAIIVVMGLVTAIAAQIWLPSVAPKEVSAAPVTLGSYWQLARRRSVQLLLLLRGLPTVYWATGQLVIGIQLLRLTGFSRRAGPLLRGEPPDDRHHHVAGGLGRRPVGERPARSRIFGACHHRVGIGGNLCQQCLGTGLRGFLRAPGRVVALRSLSAPGCRKRRPR